jgi:hypothetical protein
MFWWAWVIAILLGAARGSAAPFVDPFLERFRIGAFRDPQAISMAGAWPADVFEPLVADSLWLAEAADFFAPPKLAHRHGSIAWRILVPALGDYRNIAAWYEGHRASWRLLASYSDSSGCPPPAQPPATGWLRVYSYIRAYKCYEQKRYETSYHIVQELLNSPLALEMTSEEKMIWGLRLRALGDLSGIAPPQSQTEPWPEMLALGSFDSQSAWSLWTACRRARGWPLLSSGTGTRELGLWLSRLPSTNLQAEDLESAGFAADIESGLGAAVLARGPALARHFQRFAAPPEDAECQILWLNGQRRRHGYQAAVSESLAALPGLRPPWRLDLWRRASEQMLLRGHWDEGMRDLENALALLATAGSNRMRVRLRAWTLQALALAEARERGAEAERIWRLAQAHMADEDQRLFREAAAEYGLRGGPLTGEAEDLFERARRTVRSGRAREVALGASPDLARAARAQETLLWRLWTHWGEGLIASADSAAAHDAACLDYADDLREVADAPDGAAKLAAACVAMGRWFRASPLRNDLLEWLLRSDLARATPTGCLTEASPVPGWCRELPRGSLAADLTRHALLGLCLATGDQRGQLAAALALPPNPLTALKRLQFLYPLPGPGPIAAGLSASGLEASLLLAMARNESLFDPAARSRAGALGWLQVMPFHFPGGGFSQGQRLWGRPGASIGIASDIIKDEARLYDGDPYRVVAAYNAGRGAVQRWDRQLGGRRERSFFLVWIGYPETQAYVEKVLIDREIYDWILMSVLERKP